MSTNPKVSVVIPTYRRISSLLKAVKSVLDQSYSNFEVLVINDYKNDFDLIQSQLEKYKDSRVLLFNNTHTKGGNGARNTGVEKSTGDYIAFLDDDDLFDTNKIDSQIKYMLNNSLKGTFCNYINSSGRPFYKESIDKIVFNIKDYIRFKLLIGSSSTLMFQRSVFDEVMWDETLSRLQDYDFIIRYSKKFDLIFCPYPLVILPNDNDGMKLNKKNIISLIKVLIRFFSNYYSFTDLSMNILGILTTLKLFVKHVIIKKIYG